MKKLLYVVVLAMVVFSGIAQEQTANEAAIDRKFRFGLRITPQPTWFTTDQKQMTTLGLGFGFGFGLNMEYHFSEIVALVFGIGGDFESGRVQFSRTDNFKAQYWLNDIKEFEAPSANRAGHTVYTLKERKISTTFVTLPVILKLSTKEYNGLKYFGMFGVEVGVRTKVTANDTYYESGKFNSDSIASYVKIADESTENKVNINEEASLLPLRLGLNVGIGTEYRLGGSTSLLFSINYFHSFTNLMKSKASKYTYYSDNGTPGDNKAFIFLKQNLIMNAIRINIGVMF
jgi:hypothetical protein